MSRSSITDELFEATADMPPSRRISLQQVHADGRRIRRRRRIVRSTVACAVVAGLVAGGATAFGAVGNPFGERSNRQSPASEGSSSPAAPKPPAEATAPGKLHPSWLRIKTGWLPEACKQPGVTREVDTRSDEQDVRFSSGSGRLDTLVVSLYAAGGRTPQALATAEANREQLGFANSRSVETPGPEINGRASLWRADPSDSGGTSKTSANLWLQWEQGAWGEIMVSGDFGAPAKEIAVNIARGLAFDQPEPVKVPFPMPKVPAGFTVVGTQVEGQSHITVFISDRPLGIVPSPNAEKPPFKVIMIMVGGNAPDWMTCRSLNALTYATHGKWDNTDVGASADCVIGNTLLTVRVTKDLMPTFPQASQMAMFNEIAKGLSPRATDTSTWTAIAS